ncbi:MAG: GntR family transcriptional regulator [Polyangiaceae bacterium]
MLLRIDAHDERPLYAQIASQLRRALIDGEVAEGERLPPARELAESLDVNMHTVLRAYDELRSEGVLEMRRGRGVSVVASGRNRARLMQLGRAFVAEGVRQGLSLVDLRRILGEVT